MSYTIDDVINDARMRLQDYSDESYSDNDMLRYTNDGVRDFAQTGCCQGVATATLATASSADLSATEILNVFRVERNGTALDWADLDEPSINWNSATFGTAAAWTYWNKTLYVNASDSATLRYWYTYIPADVTAITDTLAVPDSWFTAIVNYVCYRALRSNADQDYQAEWAEYQAAKAQAFKVFAKQISLNRGGMMT